MQYGFDLNPRQARRITLQAIGERASVWLEPHGWPDPDPVLTEFLDADDAQWKLALEPDPTLTASRLVGRCVDGTFTVAEQRYQFSSYVIGVQPQRSPDQLLIARPESLLVVQRRRYKRHQLKKSSAVRMCWSMGEHTTAALGDLLNTGPEGMACSLPCDTVETLLVGNPVQIEFNLPEIARRFMLDAEVVGKTASSSPDRMVVGVCFVEGRRPEADQSLADLREHLTTLLTPEKLPFGGQG